MTERTVAGKLRFKPGMRAALLRLPAGVELGIPRRALVQGPAGADFVVAFADTQAAAEDLLVSLAAAVTDKTVAWVGYPKGSNAAGHDLNRDTVAAAARAAGLVVNANFAIDAKWSALRVRPLRPGE